ncbi:MAG: pitrilysin family protein [Cyclobacteriaceae bacterium]
MEEYQLHTLPNGIRIVHKQVNHTKIMHCGIMFDVGSRDEGPDQQGIAHFWEHMAFKGTKKRNAFHIINSLESVGGELNAYTTKEKICFYASVLGTHFDKAVDLICDIAFSSTFPTKQIEKERGVILEEMAMYYDSPEDAIQDDFDEVIFADHQLGRNILGNAESVKSFKQEDFHQFVKENLNSEQIIFSSVGNLPMKKVVKLAEKYLKDIPTFKASHLRTSFQGYTPKKQETRRTLTQAQCAIGSTAYPLVDERRLPFFMLLNILGGPGMNSRLNLSLREKYGLVYSVDASYSPYTDTGSMAIFFGTEPKQVNRGISLVLKEMKKLREKELGSMQLHKAKQQLMGQLAMSEENYNSLMLGMAKSLLDLNKIQSIESIFDQIKAVKGKDLLEIANEAFREERMSVLTFLPE